jgi:hypothetical protein
VAYATINPGPGLLAVLTDTNGNFTLEVPPGWTGTITPAKGEWTFAPLSRAYAGLDQDSEQQDFIMISPSVHTLTRQQAGTNLVIGWFGVQGLSYQLECSTNLVDWFPCESACVGTNGPATVVVPVGQEASGFFRLRPGD